MIRRQLLHRSREVFASIVLILLTLDAHSGTSFIELTHSNGGRDYDSVQTIGIYGVAFEERNEITYSGLQYVAFDSPAGTTDTGMYRILIGFSMKGKYRPYIELGTDFLGLFASRQKETDCNQPDGCRINAFLRAGLRIRVVSDITLGVFHESMSFDDTDPGFSQRLNYTGISISKTF